MISLGLGVGPTHAQARRAPGFSPRALFSDGALGAYFDMQTAQMYQDVAAQMPVTQAGERVALVMSQSQGGLGDPIQDSLGPERSARTSGTFGGGAQIDLINPVHVGALYQLSYKILRSDYSGDMFLRPASGPFAYQVLAKSPGTHRYFVTAEDAQTGYMRFGGVNPTGSTTFEHISLREVYVGHAVQANASQRPIWQNHPARLSFDPGHAPLTISLPDLGTEATEFWADTAGVSIHSGVSVAAGLRPLPTPSQLYAYGILNRALTASETQTLAGYLQNMTG